MLRKIPFRSTFILYPPNLYVLDTLAVGTSICFIVQMLIVQC